LGDWLNTHRKISTSLERVEFDAGFFEHGDETFGRTGLAELLFVSQGGPCGIQSKLVGWFDS
jgi:hypothetical protein